MPEGKFGFEMSTQLSVVKLGPSLYQCGGWVFDFLYIILAWVFGENKINGIARVQLLGLGPGPRISDDLKRLSCMVTGQILCGTTLPPWFLSNTRSQVSCLIH
jgi:hypothetical protein